MKQEITINKNTAITAKAAAIIILIFVFACSLRSNASERTTANVIKHITIKKADTVVKDTTPLNEMVVLGMTSPGNKSANTTASHSDSAASGQKNVHPQTGWAGFTRYLKDNAKSPDGKTGEVKLSLLVNDQGNITGIKVVKGVSAETNQKAISLVNNGPKWVGNHTGKPENVMVRVVFDR